MGKLQVCRLAKDIASITVDYVYTSPLQRAFETASQIGSAHGLQCHILNDLTEIDFGKWEGIPLTKLEMRKDWQAFLSSRTSCTPHGGESIQSVQKRMVRAVTALPREHPGSVIVVVSHADPLRTLIAYYLNLSLDLISTFDISPASVTALDVSEDKAVIRYMNCQSCLANQR